MAFYNVIVDPTATNEVTVAFLWHCTRKLREPWRFTFFKNSAGLPRGRNQSLTGFKPRYPFLKKPKLTYKILKDLAVQNDVQLSDYLCI